MTPKGIELQASHTKVHAYDQDHYAKLALQNTGTIEIHTTHGHMISKSRWFEFQSTKMYVSTTCTTTTIAATVATGTQQR
jgi:hypothetical protein